MTRRRSTTARRPIQQPARKTPRRTDEVGHWVQSLPETFIQCRDLGHVWQSYRAWWDSAEGAFQRVLRCSRCTAERAQLVARNGAAMSSHYDYPDGYSKPAGSGFLTSQQRATIRLESTLRLVELDTANATEVVTGEPATPPVRSVGSGGKSTGKASAGKSAGRSSAA